MFALPKAEVTASFPYVLSPNPKELNGECVTFWATAFRDEKSRNDKIILVRIQQINVKQSLKGQIFVHKDVIFYMEIKF